MKGRALNEKDVDYFVALIMGWIGELLLRIDESVMQDWYRKI